MCLAADQIAVIEDNGSLLLKSQHRFDMPANRCSAFRHEGGRIALAHRAGLFERTRRWDVTINEVMRRGLIRHDVGNDAAAQDFGEYLRRIPAEADRHCTFCRAHRIYFCKRLVKMARDNIKVADSSSFRDSIGIDIDAQDSGPR